SRGGSETRFVRGARRFTPGSPPAALFEIHVPGSRADRRCGEHGREVLAVVWAVVLAGVEGHAATGVAVVVAADRAHAGHGDVGAALDVLVVPVADRDADHLAGL